MHILFVPEFAPPKGASFGTGGAGGLTREAGKITYSYSDANRTVESQAIVIDHKFVACGTRRFNLADGNVVVVHVTPDGKTSATQLHKTLHGRSEAADVLTVVKNALPDDRWLQAINPANP